MKIGIITRWCSFNYGTNLQLWALYHFLKDAGHSPFLIRYYRSDFIHNLVPNSVYGNDEVSFMKYLAAIFCMPMEFYTRQIGQFTDQSFDVSPRIYQSGEELREHPPEADIYITGSDQVWNFWSQKIDDKVRSDTHSTLLQFGADTVKRFSFAASFGNQTLADGYKEIFVESFRKFDYVSVREKAAIEVCKECGVADPEWVPDPTLLLSAQKYLDVLPNDGQVIPAKPYIFLYLLNNNLTAIEHAKKLAESRGCELRIVGANLAYGLSVPGVTVSATVPQFVHLIANASYVLTDSFHGTAFSLIFNRQFANLPSPRRSASDTRFQSIFERLGVQSRTIGDDFVLPDDLDYTAINKAFDTLRSTFSTDWFNKKT